jgi:hypothetical protein
MSEETQVIDSPSSSSAAVDAPPSASAPAAAASEPQTSTVDNRSTDTPGRTGPSRSERIEALRGKARDHYRLTGDLNTAEAKMGKTKSDAPAASSPASDSSQPGASIDAQTEAASGPAEPKPSRQDRDWRNLREKTSTLERELLAAKAKLEVYERERAGSGPSAPATPQTQPVQQPQASDPRPKFPDINQFNDPKKFQAAVDQWQQKDSEWVQRQFDQRLTGERARQTQEKATEAWTSQLDSARKVHADYDSVVFSDKVPLSYVTQGLIQSLPDGALRAYALAKNLSEASRVAELTAIPGENRFKSYGEFMQAISQNPQLAMLYGEKLALARMELQKLTVGKSKAPTDPPTNKKPLKEVIAGQPRPSAEVNVEENASPVQDPAARALKDGDFQAYKRLMNEQDRRRMANRR